MPARHHTLLASVRAIHGDPTRLVRDHFQARDAELTRHALTLLREHAQP